MKKTIIILLLAVTYCGFSQTDVRIYKLKTAKQYINSIDYSKGISILDELIKENENDTLALFERAKAYYEYAKNETPGAELFKKSISDLEHVKKLQYNSFAVNFTLFKVLYDYVDRCGIYGNPYNRDKTITKEIGVEKLKEAKQYLIEAHKLNGDKEIDFDKLLIKIDDLITKNSI